MSVDLSKLSSKELFELAKRREQEEQESAQRVASLDAARKKRDKMVADHDAAIAATDKAIQELEAKREKQIDDFEAALAPLELEIEELERQINADQCRAQETAQAAPAPKAAPPAPQAKSAPAPSPAPAAAPAKPKSGSSAPSTSEDLIGLIRGMMRNRTYISESLMKEKLKAAGFDMTNLRKQLEQLIHEKRLENKGRGNYALGKRK